MIGSGGQLGTDLMNTLSTAGSFEPIGLTHSDIEVSDPLTVSKIASLRPHAVINTAAFHKTDACKDDPRKAFEVNALGPLHIAKACTASNAINISQSTDYVFGGDKKSPYTESDDPSPINVYGIPKLAGEKMTTSYSPSHYIIRSSSLFGLAGASGKGGISSNQ